MFVKPPSIKTLHGRKIGKFYLSEVLKTLGLVFPYVDRKFRYNPKSQKQNDNIHIFYKILNLVIKMNALRLLQR